MDTRPGSVALYHDKAITEMEFPDTHPMTPYRLEMTMALIDSMGLCDKLLMPSVVLATPEEMCVFHDPAYIQFLQDAARDGYLSTRLQRERYNVLVQYQDTDADCPFIPNMWHYASRYVGASLCAARLLSEKNGCSMAINWMGGMHHACAAKASGFCYVNDIVLAIHELLKTFRRVLYLDIDVHHGDGVETAFYSDRRVMTLSIHQYGRGFFPGTGDVTCCGPKSARGYCLNIPVPSWTGDHTFTYLFTHTFTKVLQAFDPEVIVMQCGADSVTGDRLGNLNVSSLAHAACVRHVLQEARETPVLLLGGGGYTPENVARIWALETAVAVGIDPRDIPDQVPEHFMTQADYGASFAGKTHFFIRSKPPPRHLGDAFTDPHRIDVAGIFHTLELSLNSVLRDRVGINGGRIELAADPTVLFRLLAAAKSSRAITCKEKYFAIVKGDKIKKKEEVEKIEKFTCATCGKSISSKRGLRKHVLKFHTLLSADPIVEDALGPLTVGMEVQPQPTECEVAPKVQKNKREKRVKEPPHAATSIHEDPFLGVEGLPQPTECEVAPKVQKKKREKRVKEPPHAATSQPVIPGITTAPATDPVVHQCTGKATCDGQGTNKQSLKNRSTVVMRTEGATPCPCTSQLEGTTGIPIEFDGCRTKFSCSESKGMRKHLSKVHSIHFVTILRAKDTELSQRTIPSQIAAVAMHEDPFLGVESLPQPTECEVAPKVQKKRREKRVKEPPHAATTHPPPIHEEKPAKRGKPHKALVTASQNEKDIKQKKKWVTFHDLPPAAVLCPSPRSSPSVPQGAVDEVFPDLTTKWSLEWVCESCTMANRSDAKRCATCLHWRSVHSTSLTQH